MPVIFPDGTTAEILYPPDLDLAGTNIHPYTSAVAPAGVSRDFVIDYGRVDEVLRDWGEVELLDEYPDGQGGSVDFWRTPDSDYLAFQFGSWTVLVYDYQDGEARMSEEQRSLWATHLHGREVAGGWLILEADPPLTLARAGEHAGPELQFLIPGKEFKQVLLFAGACTPIRAGKGFDEADIETVHGVAVARTRDAHGEWYALWCDPSVPMRVDVYAGKDKTLIDALFTGMEIRAESHAEGVEHDPSFFRLVKFDQADELVAPPIGGHGLPIALELVPGHLVHPRPAPRPSAVSDT